MQNHCCWVTFNNQVITSIDEYDKITFWMLFVSLPKSLWIFCKIHHRGFHINPYKKTYKYDCENPSWTFAKISLGVSWKDSTTLLKTQQHCILLRKCYIFHWVFTQLQTSNHLFTIDVWPIQMIGLIPLSQLFCYDLCDNFCYNFSYIML